MLMFNFCIPCFLPTFDAILTSQLKTFHTKLVYLDALIFLS